MTAQHTNTQPGIEEYESSEYEYSESEYPESDPESLSTKAQKAQEDDQRSESEQTHDSSSEHIEELDPVATPAI